EADSRHRGALLRAQSVWLDLDRISALAAGREAQESESRSPAQELLPRKRQHRVKWLVSAAAAIVLSVGVGVYWAHDPGPNVYMSEIGEVKRFRLGDGSSMVLNTATRATVRMDEAHRDIRLIEGEGIFEVAKDPTRPFIVYAGPVTIRA